MESSQESRAERDVGFHTSEVSGVCMVFSIRSGHCSLCILLRLSYGCPQLLYGSSKEDTMLRLYLAQHISGEHSTCRVQLGKCGRETGFFFQNKVRLSQSVPL